MASPEQRQRIAAAISALILSPLLRDDSLDALDLFIDRVEKGRSAVATLSAPGKSKPIEAQIITGALTGLEVQISQSRSIA